MMDMDERNGLGSANKSCSQCLQVDYLEICRYILPSRLVLRCGKNYNILISFVLYVRYVSILNIEHMRKCYKKPKRALKVSL